MRKYYRRASCYTERRWPVSAKSSRSRRVVKYDYVLAWRGAILKFIYCLFSLSTCSVVSNLKRIQASCVVKVSLNRNLDGHFLEELPELARISRIKEEFDLAD
jgi:hypothetical protein